MVEIKELTYILTIAREGSISRAAEKLYISQPGLSQFLKNFEAAIGTVLFYRTPSGVHPTCAGELFLKKVQEIDRSYQALMDQLKQIHMLELGVIRFGIPAAKSVLFLPDILNSFHRKFPQITVSITEHNSRALEEMIISQQLDAALISTPLNNDSIINHPITGEEIFLAVSPSHPLLKLTRMKQDGSGRMIEPEQISGMDFIVSEPGTKLRKITDRLFSDCRIETRTLYSVSNVNVALEMAQNGLGITFVSALRVPDPSDLIYISLGESGIYRDVVITYSAGACHSKTVEAFASQVYTTIRDRFPH
ncbi:MAG: LysR family transcriptional regulator [Clostridium sp.]|nr:LysR family transcriptional regulator [Clostridium sp.]